MVAIIRNVFSASRKVLMVTASYLHFLKQHTQSCYLIVEYKSAVVEINLVPNLQNCFFIKVCNVALRIVFLSSVLAPRMSSFSSPTIRLASRHDQRYHPVLSPLQIWQCCWQLHSVTYVVLIQIALHIFNSHIEMSLVLLHFINSFKKSYHHTVPYY